MTDNFHSFTVRRLLKADRARVFEAFSRSEAIAQWFKPSTDISVEVLAFRFAKGGSYRLQYTMPDGSRPVLGGTYELIAPPDELIFSWMWEAPALHANILTRVHILLQEMGNSTEIVISHEQVPSEEIATRHAEGWEAGLNILEHMLARNAIRTSPKPRDSHDA